MEICKESTVRLKALNKHNRYSTHNMHRDGKCYQQFNKKVAYNVDINKDSRITM